jgi:hypothetical protein
MWHRMHCFAKSWQHHVEILWPEVTVDRQRLIDHILGRMLQPWKENDKVASASRRLRVLDAGRRLRRRLNSTRLVALLWHLSELTRIICRRT